MPNTSTSPTPGAAKYWSQVEPSWLEFENELDEISDKPGRLAITRLDLKRGTGLTTLQLAGRVGINRLGAGPRHQC